MPKPVIIKFEKAAGAVNTYAVNALNADYSPAGKKVMVPGDEAAVSHFQAHSLTSGMPECFSTRGDIDPEIVAAEEAVDKKIVLDNQAEAIAKSSNILDQVNALKEKVGGLEARIAAIEKVPVAEAKESPTGQADKTPINKKPTK